MTSTYSSADSFKLIRPTLPIRANGSLVDSYAEDEIDIISQVVGKVIWPKSIQNCETRHFHHHHHEDDSEWKKEFIELCGKATIVESIDPLVSVKEKSSTSAQDLEGLLGADGKTSLLFKVQTVLKSLDLGFNESTLLDKEPIELFLFAHAIYVQELEDPASIAKYIVDNDNDSAIAQCYEIIAKKALMKIAIDERIDVGDIDKFWLRKRNEVIDGGYSFEAESFQNNLREIINDYAFNDDTLTIIEEANVKLGLTLEKSDKDFLIDYFQQSNININTVELAKRFIPIALSHQKNATLNFLSPGTSTNDSLDFSVNYYEDSSLASEINKENVHCSAQLFYVMTLGEELGVFSAVDLLITQYLATGIVDVRSPQLLRDLQNNAFNDNPQHYITTFKVLNLKYNSNINKQVDINVKKKEKKQKFNILLSV